MRVDDFNFELPKGLIAQTPPAVRGSSRMLVMDRATGAIRADEHFPSLPEYLRPGDLLVLNDSRVIPARLFAVRGGLTTQETSPAPSGRIEVLLTRELEPQPGNSPDPGLWSALVRPARKITPGETLRFLDRAGADVLTAEVVARGEFGERTLRFGPAPDFLERLARVGHMPLPPYIHREAEAEQDDRERYQTVYAATPGSAAAPTAGLHFTPEMLAALEARGVESARVTLHVGLGTFQPVRVETLDAIRLHAERYTLPATTAEAIHRARRDGRRVIAVGTTTTRTLEHCAATVDGDLHAHTGSTEIFIRPGHRFRVVDGLLTNFHLPQSTLLMLVSALLAPADDLDAGRRRALAAYAHAVQERYRFFSYGDCMLIV